MARDLSSDPADADDPAAAAVGTTPVASLIAEAMSRLPPELFALLDGALYDDMPFLLTSYRLRGRPVFLEAGDADAVASGPFLVPLDSPDQISSVTALVGQGRTPVIWSWPDGEQSLYRHLRTLNLASVPVEKNVDDDVASEAEWTGSDEVPEVVMLFRHWDPHVLSAVGPQLTPVQASRFFGNAHGVSYCSHDGSVQCVLNAGGAAVSAAGMLKFDDTQVSALARTRLNQSRLNIMGYLREAAAEELQAVNDEALHALVVEAEISGNTIGLASEHAHGLWAYLHVLTEGETSRSQEVRQHFFKAAEDPETTLQAVLAEVLAELEQG